MSVRDSVVVVMLFVHGLVGATANDDGSAPYVVVEAFFSRYDSERRSRHCHQQWFVLVLYKVMKRWHHVMLQKYFYLLCAWT